MGVDRRRTCCILAVAALVLAAAAAPLRADSIWDRRQASAAFLYSDTLASEVGDSLTVIISETSTFKQQAARTLEKDTSSTAHASFKTPVVDLSIASGDADHDSTRKFTGTMDYNGKRIFADSVTVTVVDKLPNGNMVVGGRSNRQIAGESVNTILTGIVKPEDIGAGNAVSSARVAYLCVYYETNGTSESFVKDDWLSRILDVFWPF